jgi:hypothetical protein
MLRFGTQQIIEKCAVQTSDNMLSSFQRFSDYTRRLALICYNIQETTSSRELSRYSNLWAQPLKDKKSGVPVD